MTPSRVRPHLVRTLFLALAAIVAVLLMSTYVGLLNDAVAVSPWQRHEAPRLGRTPGGTAAVAVAPDEAYELGYGIASRSGLVYWAVAALLIIAASRRLHNESRDPVPRPRLW